MGAGRRSIKEEPGSGSRDGCSRTSLEAVTETFREGPRGCLNWNHRRKQGSVVQRVGEVESSQIHSSRVGTILYIIAV